MNICKYIPLAFSLAFVACVSKSFSTKAKEREAKEAQLYTENIQPLIENGKGYKFFKVYSHSDSFRNVKIELLDSPRIKWKEGWDYENDYPTGEPGKIDLFFYDLAPERDKNELITWIGSYPKTKIDLEFHSPTYEKKYGMRLRHFNAVKIEKLEPYETWSFEYAVLSTTKKNASTETTLYASPAFERAFITNYTEARTPDSREYPISTAKTDGKYRSMPQVTIPTKDIVDLAETEKDLTVRIYGRLRNDQLTAYQPVIPNWYLKAYVFSLLENNWLDQESVGQSLYKEFKEKTQD